MASSLLRALFCILLLGAICAFCASVARGQAPRVGASAEAWGQLYRPAGLVNLEARLRDHPWLRLEAQVWGGESALASQDQGDVVVLVLHARDPEGHGDLRAGRFVLASGAVRPVHLDGAHVRAQADKGTSLEVFGGVPVVPRFAARAYDWLLGGRAAQRFADHGALGVSFVERRDHGALMDRELGADLVFYLPHALSVSGRASYDLASRGVSEINVTGSWGQRQRRLELFGIVRNPSLLLPATSLFSVLSDVASHQAGVSGRVRVAPRLRLDGLLAYRGAGREHGVRALASANLWLDDEGKGAIEGNITRDGVGDAAWTGLRALFYRDLIDALRLGSEVELVLPDERRTGRLWPWARLSGRYAVNEHWHLGAAVEASASPQFSRMVQGLLRVGYEGGVL